MKNKYVHCAQRYQKYGKRYHHLMKRLHQAFGDSSSEPYKIV